ncbi:hypothetical protein QCA50_008255 [Cerrena zonata]|uniref:Iminophenyl-pyruvate dimer synthase domain-containing protein n=1 Tax=Cerrena zonata TaxID=2478898 RepID=A0AAW0G8H1_9APHY
MLHLILAGNVLKATGASPKLYLAPHWPTYPMDMAGHSGSLVLNLQSLDLQQLECFLAVEAPTTQGAPLEPDDYDTLGQFYEAIQDALIRLRPHYSNYEYQFSPSDNVFNTDPYGGGGIVMAEDNGSALSALQIIIDQGEGFNETQFENPPGSLANADKGWVMTLAHYYKFKSIYDTKPLPKIYPNLLNPTSNTYKDPNIALTSYWVDSVYCFFLLVIEQTWQASRDTAPAERQQLLNMYFTIMISIIKPVATWLAQQPMPEQPGKNAGAVFNFYDFRVAYKTDPQMTPLKQVKHQADLAIQSFPTAGKTVPQVLADANSQCMNLTELPFPWQD